MDDTRDEGAVWLTERFEAYRPRLRAVAYRMLGSLTEADDAVQECWLRLRRADAQEVGNLGGWLTTVVARICLDFLRARRLRREEPLDPRLPEPVISGDAVDPEQEALLADAVGLALIVVLDTLAPAERLAFVLHDMFDVPFDEIAAVLGRSAPATRQLASRARRRVQNAAPAPDPDLGRQRQVVDAFLAAARSGDFDALVSLLDPEIVLRGDIPGGSTTLRGATAVAGQAMAYSARAEFARNALINGAAGLVVVARGRPIAVMAFSVVGGTIAELDIIADPDRLARLDPSVFASPAG
ncbi:MAG TPA: sigma-70 family RNA polymerase sigma factor [Micromonosporaceae bacterium]|nr:sigma-70 family RNA polymerase sigma factor [Micromonosporaceae bacterium]